MAEKVARYPTISVIALAACVIVLYSWWGATLLQAQREAAYSPSNPQAQLARN